MSSGQILTILHLLAAFWYVMGLTAVQVSLVRGWRSQELSVRADSLAEASHYQGVLLVPGAIAGLATGLFLWADLGYNLLTTGWLVVLEVLYLVTLLVCLPVVGVGLRRMRVAALKARRMGRVTADQEEAMSDAAPLVLSGIATGLVPAMTFLAVARPF